jgi:hypothetical protein
MNLVRLAARGAFLLYAAPPASAQSSPQAAEVRQIVTFLFLPGRAGEATQLFQEKLRPIYRDLPHLLRVRGYREVESPEPLDLVVVSSYRGMEGMDRANEGLRRPSAVGPSAISWYASLAAMTQAHHDQFVEMIPLLSDTATSGGLTVFEYLRLVPGRWAAFERLLAARVRPLERERKLVQWSETGRLLVSDDWDALRIIGLGSLADWQRYRSEVRAAPFSEELEGHVVARKTIIVREVPGIAVR